MKEKSKRTRIIGIRLTPQEFAHLESYFKATTSRKLSDHVRNVLLHGKVTVLTRNQSLDDFMAELIQLRIQLQGAGNNLNQAVRKLHTFRDHRDVSTWLITYQDEVNAFFEKVAVIKSRINQFADKW
jgi:mobilization protein MobC